MIRPQTGPPPFPERLERNLRSYRRTMRRTKLTEHFAVALTALVASFLVVAALDRLFDTSALLRGLLLGMALAVAAVVVHGPWASLFEPLAGRIDFDAAGRATIG